MTNIVHFYRADAKKSSRISAQLKIDNGTVVDKMKLVDLSVFSLFLKASDGDVFVFHQQSSILNLVFCMFINFFRNKVNIIYDIHDLLEYESYENFKGKASYFVFLILERFVFFNNIRTLTVSDGLADIYYLKYKKKPEVFYNIPNCKYVNDSRGDRLKNKSLLYFGQIQESRLPISLLEYFKNKNIVVDVYGFFVESDGYKDAFYKYEKEGVVNYLGEYTPDNIINIASGYSFSLVYFPSERVNIKYCLPNKLFQSFEAGVKCVISENLSEIDSKFRRAGGVIYLSELDVNDESSDLDSKVLELVEELRIKSIKSYQRIVYGFEG